MTPDAAALVDDVRPAANGDARRGGLPDILLLHYTGMPDAEGALRLLVSDTSGVSCHYLVDEDGRIVQMVPEARRAWHAGAGSWNGRGDVNSRSIGIEIQNPGHEFGYRAFPDRQIQRVIALCADILARHPAIPARHVLAHSDTAPARKTDPGELFPWDRLRAAGIGHLVPPEPLRDGETLRPGDSGDGVAAWQAMLARYGYETDADACFGEATRLATLAFQRHFRPARLDGAADLSTRETLRRLLAELGADGGA